MEDLPKIIKSARLPLSLPVPDYLRDHVFNGRAVFPAVEAMRVLAESAQAAVPGLDVRVITAADFSKFLSIEPDTVSFEAFNDIATDDAGKTISKLVTVRKQGTTSITRSITHVTVTFPGSYEILPEPPRDATLGLEGICVQPSKERIYSDLVPFLPAYQNVEHLYVSKQGALAVVSGGTDDAPAETLGSPFPLDASFHAACVWGQRYAGIVGFPVHLDARIIRKKTVPRETYVSRITPVSAGADLLVYDLWIYDMAGNLCEEIRGLHMRDVSGKTILPPRWILEGADDDAIVAKVLSWCRDYTVIELGTITEPCMVSILSKPERDRAASMREKRRLTFCSARLALKILSRRLSGNDTQTLPEEITTTDPEGRPCCPLTTGDGAVCCTASHDGRFAVAAVSDHPLGIDVEEITPRVLRGWNHYMHDEEIALATNHPLGKMEASVRVWSAKEAVSKATGLHLVETWRKAIVKEIGEDKSIIAIDGTDLEALHAVLEGHIVTLVILQHA